MQRIVLSAIVAAGLGITTAGFSQETTETTEEPKTEETTTDTSSDTTNSQDETFPVAEENTVKVGTEFIKEAHGDWQIVCTVLAENQKAPCRLYQLLKDENDLAVAEMSIVALSKAEKAVAGVNFITPLGTLLTAQASMRIDSGKVQKYPFQYCINVGCVTRFGLTEGELNNLKKGSKAVMTIAALAAPDAPISLNVSLSGFTAGWNALKTEAEAETKPEETAEPEAAAE